MGFCPELDEPGAVEAPRGGVERVDCSVGILELAEVWVLTVVTAARWEFGILTEAVELPVGGAERDGCDAKEVRVAAGGRLMGTSGETLVETLLKRSEADRVAVD